MANGFNRVQLIGNLGDEPVVRNTQSGSCVTNITLAINETRRDQATGSNINETEWVRVVAFGRTAEIMRDYLHKGTQVHIEGKIRTRSYEDKNTGEKKYSTEVVCEPNGLLMLGGRNQDMGGSSNGNNDYQPGNSNGGYSNSRSQNYGNGNSNSYQNRSQGGAMNRQSSSNNQQQRYTSGAGSFVSSGNTNNLYGQAQPNQSQNFNSNQSFNQTQAQGQSFNQASSRSFNQTPSQSFNQTPAQNFNQTPAAPMASNPDTAPSATISDDIPF
jgi:single-strand DNA-binding protein